MKGFSRTKQANGAVQIENRDVRYNSQLLIFSIKSGGTPITVCGIPEFRYATQEAPERATQSKIIFHGTTDSLGAIQRIFDDPKSDRFACLSDGQPECIASIPTPKGYNAIIHIILPEAY